MYLSTEQFSFYTTFSPHTSDVFLLTYMQSHTVHSLYTVIWLYFALKIFRTLLFRAVLISYAPHIIYETRVKVSLLKNIRAFNIRTDGSVQN